MENLLKKEESSRRKSKSKFKNWRPLMAVIGFLFALFLLIPIFSKSSDFEFDFPVSILKQEQRTNVLLLGNAGGRHDGAELTDTIMVVSYDPKLKTTTFVSLPRDLWLEDRKHKINALYEYAKGKNRLDEPKKAIGEILGIDIHYAVRLDFNGFIKAVDEVGGIDVEVEKSFQDSLYPIAGKEDDLCGYKEEEKEFNEEEAKVLNIPAGKQKVLIAPDGKVATDSADPNFGYEHFTCRYELITFKKGTTHMDGETALKFVRSRMGTNGEGSDFARSRRQQKVIEAFRAKVLSAETLVNPVKIKGLIDAFGQSFETDMPIDKGVALYNQTKKSEKSQTFVLSNTGKDALLVNPPPSEYGGAWVLIPKDKNFEDVRIWVAKIFSGEIIQDEDKQATGAARSRDR